MCTRRPSYNVSTHDYGLWASLIMWLRRKNDVYWVTIEERVLFLDTSHLTHAYLLSRKSILWHMVEIQFFHVLINIPSFLLNGAKKGGGRVCTKPEWRFMGMTIIWELRCLWLHCTLWLQHAWILTVMTVMSDGDNRENLQWSLHSCHLTRIGTF